MTEADGKQTIPADTQGKDNSPPVEATEQPVNIVDEARAIRDEIVKAKEELKAENDRKEKIEANKVLGGTVGGHVEAPPAEETPQEYAKKVMTGEIQYDK